MLKNIDLILFKENIGQIFCYINKSSYLCTQKTSRSGAVVARQAHNLEVVGSSPASATKQEESIAFLFFCVYLLFL